MAARSLAGAISGSGAKNAKTRRLLSLGAEVGTRQQKGRKGHAGVARKRLDWPCEAGVGRIASNAATCAEEGGRSRSRNGHCGEVEPARARGRARRARGVPLRGMRRVRTSRARRRRGGRRQERSREEFLRGGGGEHACAHGCVRSAL